jgi:uncharacterized protein (DUF2141 family)
MIQSCARQGRPEGGEKDITAPIFIVAEPEHESLNFNAKKIRLNFNEFVKLKNINEQLVVSPPMQYQPEITPVGTASKTISIKIIDTLKENTTYTFNFGNSVEDNNEGIPLRSFKYVFSTGDYIDSLKVIGTVADAFEKETEENISILLYEVTAEYSDSIIYKERPNYMANTLDTISFEMTNLKAGEYLMIALKDFSNNYKFDPRQDKIGFRKNFITLPTDTIFHLRLFNEVPAFEATRPSEVKKGHIYFGYEGSPKGFEIELISEKPEGFKSHLVYEKDNDSVSYWYTPIEKDSLQFKLTKGAYKKDVTVRLRSKDIDSLLVTSESKGSLSLRDTFAILTNIPIAKIIKSKIKVLDKDSLDVFFTYKLDVSKKRLKLEFDKKYESKYEMFLMPGALEDLFGNVNDTLKFGISTKSLDSYGAIGLNVQNAKSFPYILELIDESGEVIQREISNENRRYKFEFLEPKIYSFKITYDSNNNGKWDSGNFLKRIQPEEVVFFDKKIEIRANWDEMGKIFDLK